MATSDPVGTAVASIGSGAATGAGIVTAGVLLLRLLQAGDPASITERTGMTILGTTVFVGVAAAVVTGWKLTAAIDDTWRRAVTAVVSLFGAVLLSLFAAPADMIGGPVGLALYVAALAAAAAAAHRAARRAAAR